MQKSTYYFDDDAFIHFQGQEQFFSSNCQLLPIQVALKKIEKNAQNDSFFYKSMNCKLLKHVQISTYTKNKLKKRLENEGTMKLFYAMETLINIFLMKI